MRIIGIDPGAHTGIAWLSGADTLDDVMTIHRGDVDDRDFIKRIHLAVANDLQSSPHVVIERPNDWLRIDPKTHRALNSKAVMDVHWISGMIFGMLQGTTSKIHVVSVREWKQTRRKTSVTQFRKDWNVDRRRQSLTSHEIDAAELARWWALSASVTQGQMFDEAPAAEESRR